VAQEVQEVEAALADKPEESIYRSLASTGAIASIWCCSSKRSSASRPSSLQWRDGQALGIRGSPATQRRQDLEVLQSRRLAGGNTEDAQAQAEPIRSLLRRGSRGLTAGLKAPPAELMAKLACSMPNSRRMRISNMKA